jgi:hypothetical protein
VTSQGIEIHRASEEHSRSESTDTRLSEGAKRKRASEVNSRPRERGEIGQDSEGI